MLINFMSHIQSIILEQKGSTDDCYEDRSARVLNKRYWSDSSMTIEKCKQFCFEKNYLYAGVQFASQCFCGNVINPRIFTPKTECNMQCAGDSSQMCGGSWRMNIYKNPGIIINFFCLIFKSLF